MITINLITLERQVYNEETETMEVKPYKVPERELTEQEWLSVIATEFKGDVVIYTQRELTEEELARFVVREIEE
jgi:hypothetical protein